MLSKSKCPRMQMGLIQSVEGLNRIRDWLSKKERILYQTAFRLHLQHLFFLGIQQTIFRHKLEHRVFWIFSLTAHRADFGLACFHNYTNQFLIIIINLYTHTNVLVLFFFFLFFFWRTLTNVQNK